MVDISETEAYQIASRLTDEAYENVGLHQAPALKYSLGILSGLARHTSNQLEVVVCCVLEHRTVPHNIEPLFLLSATIHEMDEHRKEIQHTTSLHNAHYLYNNETNRAEFIRDLAISINPQNTASDFKNRRTGFSVPLTQSSRWDTARVKMEQPTPDPSLNL